MSNIIYICCFLAGFSFELFVNFPRGHRDQIDHDSSFSGDEGAVNPGTISIDANKHDPWTPNLGLNIDLLLPELGALSVNERNRRIDLIVQMHRSQAEAFLNDLLEVRISSYPELAVRSRLIFALLNAMDAGQFGSLCEKALADPNLLPIQVEISKGARLHLMNPVYWASQIGNFRGELAQILAKSLFRQIQRNANPEEIQLLLESVDDNSTRDGILVALARESASSDQRISLIRANGITSDKTRRSLLGEIARTEARNQASAQKVNLSEALDDQSDREYFRSALQYYESQGKQNSQPNRN